MFLSRSTFHEGTTRTKWTTNAKLDKQDLGKGTRFAGARWSRSARYSPLADYRRFENRIKKHGGRGRGYDYEESGNGKARTRQRGESLFPRSGGYGLRRSRSRLLLHYECVHISCVASFLPLSVFPTLPRALLFALFRLLMPRN